MKLKLMKQPLIKVKFSLKAMKDIGISVNALLDTVESLYSLSICQFRRSKIFQRNNILKRVESWHLSLKSFTLWLRISQIQVKSLIGSNIEWTLMINHSKTIVKSWRRRKLLLYVGIWMYATKKLILQGRKETKRQQASQLKKGKVSQLS